MSEVEPGLVAIVDDDDGVRDSLRFLLEIAGHKVETFATADDFLTRDSGNVACLLLDQHVPGMTGLELARRLQEAGAKFPIALITGAPSAAIAARAAQLGITTVLAKPLDGDEVLALVTA